MDREEKVDKLLFPSYLLLVLFWFICSPGTIINSDKQLIQASFQLVTDSLHRIYKCDLYMHISCYYVITFKSLPSLGSSQSSLIYNLTEQGSSLQCILLIQQPPNTFTA